MLNIEFWSLNWMGSTSEISESYMFRCGPWPCKVRSFNFSLSAESRRKRSWNRNTSTMSRCCNVVLIPVFGSRITIRVTNGNNYVTICYYRQDCFKDRFHSGCRDWLQGCGWRLPPAVPFSLIEKQLRSRFGTRKTAVRGSQTAKICVIHYPP